jgi:L-malate glycosyltransferase
MLEEKKVVILYRTLPQYRIEFYNMLKKELNEHNISLTLIYGSVKSEEKENISQIKWAIFKENKILSIGPLQLIWQPCLKEIETADLVIVEQANKLLINYILFIRRMIGKQKFAFWGHGRNMQSSPSNIFNIVKRIYTNYCDWWFAYTDGVKHFLVENGYKEDQITVVQNAFDTKQLLQNFKSVTAKELSDIQIKYNIKAEDKVLLYCGSLYKEKRVAFLIEAADRLFKLGYIFKLIIIGAGPDEKIVKSLTTDRPWLIYAGAQFDHQKAVFFKLSDIFLLPGAIGLAVLDSFVMETPIITTEYPYHGPEFEYLINGYNGLITKNNIDDYVNAVSGLMKNEEQLNLLKKNCHLSAELYSVENMTANFADGIRKILTKN